MFQQILSIFVNVVMPVFAIVLVGYLAGPRLGLSGRTLSRAAYYLFIPAFVFDTISKADVALDLASRMVLYIFAVHAACALLGYLTAKLLGRSRETAAAYVLIAVFGNVGNFGLPLITFRLGEAARVPATVYFLAILVIAFVICVGTASWTKGGKMAAVLSVFKTPALVALLPAGVFAAGGFPVPLTLSRMTGLLGGAMIPVMLLTLGVQLSEVKRLTIGFDTVAASGVRLLGGPTLAMLMVIPFGLSGIERGAGILQSGMPAAILTSIIAIEHDIVPDFVTTTVLFSTLAGLLTLPILLFFT